MAKTLIDDCFASNRPRLSHAEAIASLRDRARPVVGSQFVPLAEANGRTLADAIVAVHPVPAHTNAAVDGFAFAHAAYKVHNREVALAVAGRASAGHALDHGMAPGEAARIFTGAVMPAGTDTVAMQEDCELLGDGAACVLIPAGLMQGANVRRAGEDVAAGSTLFRQGHILRPQDLASLASLGRDQISCHRRLRVAIVSTGDEVMAPGGAALAEGQVYDANTPMLAALATAAGAEVRALGIWPDRPELVAKGLAATARDFDVILTSGGASRGEEDHMAAALAKLGTRHFWQIAVKPGRPMMLGQIGDTVVVGLPGNPVAVFVCFLIYVHPLLRRLGGAPWREPRRFMLPAAFAMAKRKTGRREFWRGMLIEGEAGMMVDKFARDGSGLISGLVAADGLIDVPEDVATIGTGDPVAFIPFSEFGMAG